MGSLVLPAVTPVRGGGEKTGITIASEAGRNASPGLGATVKSWLSKVFETNVAGLNWGRGALILDVLLVPLVVYWSIGHEEYLVSSVFGVLFRRWSTRAAGTGAGPRTPPSSGSSGPR